MQRYTLNVKPIEMLPVCDGAWFKVSDVVEHVDELNAEIESLKAQLAYAKGVPVQKDVFDFLCRMYVQRSDARQMEMGLQYTEAETHDLAKQIAKFCVAPITHERDTLREVLSLLAPDLKAMAILYAQRGDHARSQALNNIAKSVGL